MFGDLCMDMKKLFYLAFPLVMFFNSLDAQRVFDKYTPQESGEPNHISEIPAKGIGLGVAGRPDDWVTPGDVGSASLYFSVPLVDFPAGVRTRATVSAEADVYGLASEGDRIFESSTTKLEDDLYKIEDVSYNNKLLASSGMSIAFSPRVPFGVSGGVNLYERMVSGSYTTRQGSTTGSQAGPTGEIPSHDEYGLGWYASLSVLPWNNFGFRAKLSSATDGFGLDKGELGFIYHFKPRAEKKDCISNYP